MLSLHQILLTILIKIVVSQEPDGSRYLCSCTPLVYKWKLDFTQSCPPANISVGNDAGVKDAYCTVTNGSNLTDLKPVSVTSYQIIELDDFLVPIKVKAEPNITLKDGDVISFSSITGVQPSVISGGLQARMDGLNSADEKIVLEWIVRYSNLCEVYPYSEGNSLGWMEFVIQDDDAFPRPETCAEKSEVPSMSPTMSPTHSPTRLPSSQPSLRPSAKPITYLPTVRPSDEPTMADTEEPSEFPTVISMSYSYSSGSSFSTSVDDQNRVLHADTEFGRARVQRERDDHK